MLRLPGIGHIARRSSLVAIRSAQSSLPSPIAPLARPSFHPSVGFSTRTEPQYEKAGSVLWQTEWSELVSTGIRTDVPYDSSAERLREILKTGLLKYTDIEHNPRRFFLAHRLLADHATALGPGFWIRFTVQYNLFAGTIVALGSTEQVAALEKTQAEGLLGCFGLTERLAGVNSGLIVNTTAEWQPHEQTFLLNSPDEGAYKNWISQGLVADKCLVVADLLVGGKSYGPHAFVMDFRKNGELVPGITLGDMGRKTIGNDLDNAWISFSNIVLPKAALLNRFADIEGDEYVQKVQGIRTMDMIGQRLFTGRVAVAQAALQFQKRLFESTKAYSDSKKCWAPAGEPVLSNIPQLEAIYAEAAAKEAQMEEFLGACELKLGEVLSQGKLPDAELVQAIAVAKVIAVETAIDLCFRLKQEVGSYALMGGTGFEQMDFLQCCKFAEGDSRILMQKITRDRIKAYAARKESVHNPETEAVAKLMKDLEESGKTLDKQAAWDKNWQSVYAVANLVMDRIQDHNTFPQTERRAHGHSD